MRRSTRAEGASFASLDTAQKTKNDTREKTLNQIQDFQPKHPRRFFHCPASTAVQRNPPGEKLGAIPSPPLPSSPLPPSRDANNGQNMPLSPPSRNNSALYRTPPTIVNQSKPKTSKKTDSRLHWTLEIE